MSEGDTQKVYTIVEAAHLLRVSTNFMYKMAHEEAFPVIHLGRRFLVPKEAFDVWLARPQKLWLDFVRDQELKAKEDRDADVDR